MKGLKLLWYLILILGILALSCGGIWWGSGCAAVEKAVDDRKLQLRQDGEGWFVFAPPGFSQTVEYINHLAGLLGKRISSDPNRWEKFKLTSTCGGSTRVGSWAHKKNIRPDGSWGPQPVGGLLPVGGQWVIALLAVLGVGVLLSGIGFTRRVYG